MNRARPPFTSQKLIIGKEKLAVHLHDPPGAMVERVIEQRAEVLLRFGEPRERIRRTKRLKHAPIRRGLRAKRRDAVLAEKLVDRVVALLPLSIIEFVHKRFDAAIGQSLQRRSLRRRSACCGGATWSRRGSGHWGQRSRSAVVNDGIKVCRRSGARHNEDGLASDRGGTLVFCGDALAQMQRYERALSCMLGEYRCVSRFLIEDRSAVPDALETRRPADGLRRSMGESLPYGAFGLSITSAIGAFTNAKHAQADRNRRNAPTAQEHSLEHRRSSTIGVPQL